MRRVYVLALAVAACGRDAIPIAPEKQGGNDYNRSKLVDAVGKFVAAERTPQAFGELVATIDALRSGMDEAVSDEAELKLTTQAQVPIEAYRDRTSADQTAALATTVWAFGIRPPIEAAKPEQAIDPRDAELRPRPDEDGQAYLQRLCGGPLASDCKHVVPELQGSVIGGMAIEKLTTRARNAYAACSTCPSEPAWGPILKRWEELDAEQSSSRIADEQRSAPSNWPVAGAAAGPWPDVPRIQLEADGDLVIANEPVPPQEWIGELQMQFAERAAIGLELPPSTTVERLSTVLTAARKGGVTEVFLAARDPAYPWTLRGYRIAAAGQGKKVPIRGKDTVQVLLRAIDADIEPGQLVKID